MISYDPPMSRTEDAKELVHAALAQEHLAELVDEMEQEAGPASPEAYERVLAQWFDEG
jgi:hypothetical protein